MMQEGDTADPSEGSPAAVFVGLEIGGTNLKAGVLRDGVLLDEHRSKPIPGDQSSREPQAVVDLLVAIGAECLAEHGLAWMDVLRVGVACPGRVIMDTGVVVGAANFATWKNVPLGSMVQEATSRPTLVLNDACAAATAEVSGKSEEIIAVLTLGTGVGLGVVSAGRVMSGSRGLVEAGHMIIDPGPDARQCGCGQRGCLEAYASATAVARIARERLHSAKDTPDVPANGERQSQDPRNDFFVKDRARKLSRKLMAQKESRRCSAESALTPTPSRAAPVFPRGFSGKIGSGVRGRVEELERRTSAGSGKGPAPPVSPASTPASPVTPAVDRGSPGEPAGDDGSDIAPPSPRSPSPSRQWDTDGGEVHSKPEADADDSKPGEHAVDSRPEAGAEDSKRPDADGEKWESKRSEITAKDVFSMAQNGDEVARKVVQETCRYLGVACLNICRILDPDTILLAGGMSQAEGLVEKVREEFQSLGWTVLHHDCKIDTASACGPCMSGIAGAARAAEAEDSRERQKQQLQHRQESQEMEMASTVRRPDLINGDEDKRVDSVVLGEGEAILYVDSAALCAQSGVADGEPRAGGDRWDRFLGRGVAFATFAGLVVATGLTLSRRRG